VTQGTDRKRAARWSIIALSIAISALAIYASVQLAEQPVYHDVPIGSAAVDDADELAPPIGLPDAPADLARLTQPAGSEPLNAEPADLPAPPGGEHLLRYRTAYPDATVDQSIWTIPDANRRDASSYYEQAAVTRGFALIDRRDSPSQPITTLTFERDDQVLLVRCRQVDRGVRVVLRLRYTTAR